MNNENIYNLGDKLGLNKHEINKILINRISYNKLVSISYKSDYYKNGTRYGVVSINDL